MTTAEMAKMQVGYFDKLHKAFYDFFVEQLRKDASAFAKYRLQLACVTFETHQELEKIKPLFSEGLSNVHEKQAIARAALYDALVAHTFSGHLASQDAMLHARVDELEKNAAQGLSSLHQLLNQEVEKVRGEMQVKYDAAISKIKESVNVHQGKQVRKGPKTGQQE